MRARRGGNGSRASVRPTGVSPVASTAPMRASNCRASRCRCGAGASNHSKVASSPPQARMDEQNGGEVDADDVRLADRAQLVALVPEPYGETRAQARGSSGPLIGGIGRDALGLQRVERPRGVVAGDLLPAGVDDRAYPWHGHRCLGDVGGEDDASLGAWCQHLVLRVGWQRAVQRQHPGAVTARDALDLAHAPGRSRGRRAGSTARSRRARAARDRRRPTARRPARTRSASGCGSPATLDDRAVAEESRDRRGIDRRRHHQQAQVVAREPGLAGERKAEVGMHAALVELVEHDCRDVAQQRVLLESRREDPLGGEQHARVGARSGARSGRASRPRGRASSPAHQPRGVPATARRRAGVAAPARARRPRVQAAPASSCRRLVPRPGRRPDACASAHARVADGVVYRQRRQDGHGSA